MFSLFLGMANISFALPACPSSGYFHNCFGTYIWEDDKYVGEWKNDKQHGQGTYTWANGEKYVGEWKNGNKHGQGTFTWADGEKYVGEWQDDNRTGQGTYSYPNGNKHVGGYKDNKRYGQGTHTYASGEKYVGEYKDNKRHGQGTYSWADGEKYVGEWKNNKRNGQGTNTWGPNSEWAGDKYFGEYKDDKKHGQGFYNFANGDKYFGVWQDDKMHGQATYTYADGSKDVGEFQNGKLNGYAIQYNADGSILQEGIFKDDKFLYTEERSVTNSTLQTCPSSGNLHNCHGTYTWDNGDKYVGEFKDNKYHGKGSYTFADGENYAGEYKNGKRHGQGNNTYGNGDKYVGEYKDSKIHGYGTYYYLADNQFKGDKYVGEYRNGKRNGQGTYTYSDGENYAGEYKNDKRHGQGTNTYVNGDKYVGEYKDGKIHGYGTYYYLADNQFKGDKYFGEYKNDKRHGQGTYAFSDGAKYVGEWENDNLNGYATTYYADGSIHQEGIFKDDKFLYTEKRSVTNSTLQTCPSSGNLHNCHGTYTWDNGDKYVGEWQSNNMHGRGTYTFGPNTKWAGDEYAGEYKNGYFDGYGTYTWSSGSKYVGQYQKDKRHGKGTYTYSNGDKYIGEYQNDKRHGQGSYTYVNGSKDVGTFENGKLNGYAVTYHSDGSIDQMGIFKDDKFLYAQNNPDSANQNNCDKDPALCTIVQLCSKASYYINGEKAWKPDYNSKKYVIEAEKNGVTCGVKSEIAKSTTEEILPAASGSGFFITKNGHVITNEHVIEGCEQVKVHYDGSVHESVILSSDKFNDLALIKINYNPEVVFSLATDSPYLGQDIIAAGYPLVSDLGNTLKVTSGIVSALSAIDDTSKFQMDVPVQPGNSGGPIFDINGNILGVVVARSTHEETQLVNFGIKAATVRNLIDANNIKLQPPNIEPINKRKFSEAMTKGTVLLSCWMTLTQIEEFNTQSSGKVFFKEFQH